MSSIGLMMERCWRQPGRTGTCCASDGKEAGSIAYVQCAGSRDQTLGVEYCSRVCCMYAIKQAMLLSGALPMADITIYYMDIRTFGKGYEQFYQNAKAMGIEFVKGKVARITEDAEQNPIVRVECVDEGSRLVEQAHDLVVLSGRHAAGLRPAAAVWCADCGRWLREDSGAQHGSRPSPDRPGIFVTGTASGPMDIVDSIMTAGAAAAETAAYLQERRATVAMPVPAERSWSMPEPNVNQPDQQTHPSTSQQARSSTALRSAQNALAAPLRLSARRRRAGGMLSQSNYKCLLNLMTKTIRVGVYTCRCGGNIGDVVNVEQVAGALRKLPNVVVTRTDMSLCSDAGQALIDEDIREHGVNRIVVGACAPALHEQTFRRAVARAGLNPYFYHHVGLREQVSAGCITMIRRRNRESLSPHLGRRRQGAPLGSARTDSLGGAAARARHRRWRRRIACRVGHRAPGSQGHVDRENAVSGRAYGAVETMFPTDQNARAALHDLIEKVLAHPNITVHTQAELIGLKGYVGDFHVEIRQQSRGVSPDYESAEAAIKACPVEAPDEFNYGLTSRKAIYRAYPGCFPGDGGHRLGALHAVRRVPVARRARHRLDQQAADV